MDFEAQNDEIVVLSSIFEDNFHEDESSEIKGGELKIDLDLPETITLLTKNGRLGNLEEHKVQNLPPIHMNFTYPKNYPSAEPPHYIISCKWITRSQLSLICQKLDNLWEENKGDVVLYTWCQYIKEETALLLELSDILHVDELIPKNEGRKHASTEFDERTIQCIGPKTNLMMVLREYDTESRWKLFQNKMFECNVCFAEKLGSQCLEFWPCTHVYCNECMKGYFEVQIKEGNVKLLQCPTEKCSSEANPKQVEKLVSRELYERWDAQLLSTTLSSLGDTQPCPRPHCQYPVTIEVNQGHCPACSFVFCSLCRYGDHGLEPCRLQNSETRKVLDEYAAGDAAVKKKLEDRFGKKYLTKLNNELLSMNYLGDNSKKCPKCSANIEKTEGCNRMQCQRCNANFCWLCMAKLDPANPYQHFSGRSSSCFNKLFEGAIPEEFDDDFQEDFEDDPELFEVVPPGQFEVVPPGQFEVVPPGQFQPVYPGQFQAVYPGQFGNFHPGQFGNYNPGQFGVFPPEQFEDFYPEQFFVNHHEQVLNQE